MALVLGAFLVGSFPTGLVLARLRGIDLRKVGSGNIGATNASRALGKCWGMFVLLVDAAKGFLPAFVALRAIAGISSTVMSMIALAAVLGHVFSIFLKGRGGKGVATSFGAALAVAPAAAGLGLAGYVLLFVLFRISSVGSLAAVTIFPLALVLLEERDPAILGFAFGVMALVFARHKGNIERLLKGEELKA